MSFLAPAAGAFALVVPAILALYFLKVRRPEVSFSSSLLWTKVIRDRQANVPWQRLRFSWLLLLQILAAMALVVALMRPATSQQSRLGASTVVMIDTSQPMQATDVKPSRFEAARARARKLIDRLGPGQRMTLGEMGARPRIVASAVGDKGLLRAALSKMVPNNQQADLGASLLIAGSANGSEGAGELILLSDGLATPPVEPMSLPFSIRYEPIGRSGENLAITVIDVLKEPDGPSGFVHVQNYGAVPHHTEVEWRADGKLVDVKPADLKGGEGLDLKFPVPSGAGVVQAELVPHDDLASDDSAWAVARSPRPARIQLVTAGNIFLQQALALRPDAQVEVVSPSAWKAGESFDLYVFDRFMPGTLPSQPYWLIDPPSSAALTIGPARSPGKLRASTGDALVQGVDLGDVHVGRSFDLGRSGFGGSLVEDDAGPLIMVREGQPRAALFGFDLHDSDLPLRNAFPVLTDRLSRWLSPPSAPPAPYAPGQTAAIPFNDPSGEARVVDPGGNVQTIRPSGGSITFTGTDTPGLYRVESSARGHRLLSEFAVNGFSPGSAAIAARRSLLIPGATLASGPSRHRVKAEAWRWAAVAALGLLMLEWVAFHRGI